MYKGKTGNIVYILIVLSFAVSYIGFAFFAVPWWMELFAVLGIAFFLLRIVRGDD